MHPIAAALVLSLLSAPAVGGPAEAGPEIVEVRLAEIRSGSPVRSVAVRIHNPLPETVSRLAFTVRNDAAEIPIYRDLVFLDEIPGGGSETVELFHLTDPGKVEIDLREAWTVEIVAARGERLQRPIARVPDLASESEDSR